MQGLCQCRTQEGKGTAAGRTEPGVCCSLRGQFRGLGDIKEWRAERSATPICERSLRQKLSGDSWPWTVNKPQLLWNIFWKLSRCFLTRETILELKSAGLSRREEDSTQCQSNGKPMVAMWSNIHLHTVCVGYTHLGGYRKFWLKHIVAHFFLLKKHGWDLNDTTSAIWCRLSHLSTLKYMATSSLNVNCMALEHCPIYCKTSEGLQSDTGISLKPRSTKIWVAKQTFEVCPFLLCLCDISTQPPHSQDAVQ